VNVDIVDRARLHHVSTAQQLQETHIDPDSPDAGEYWRVGPRRGADANVPEVHGSVQDVVAELVGAELDLFSSEEHYHLIHDVATCRRSVDRDQRDDDERADDASKNSGSPKEPAPASRVIPGFS